MRSIDELRNQISNAAIDGVAVSLGEHTPGIVSVAAVVRRLDGYRVGKGKKISARRVDTAVLGRVESDLKSEEIAEVIATKMRRTEQVDGRQIAGLEKRLTTITRKVGRLIDLLTESDETDAAPYQHAIKEAESERAVLVSQLSEIRERQRQREVARVITTADVRGMLSTLFAELREGIDADQIETTKAAIGGLVERIELDPVSERCVINYRIVVVQ